MTPMRKVEENLSINNNTPNIWLLPYSLHTYSINRFIEFVSKSFRAAATQSQSSLSYFLSFFLSIYRIIDRRASRVYFPMSLEYKSVGNFARFSISLGWSIKRARKVKKKGQHHCPPRCDPLRGQSALRLSLMKGGHAQAAEG